VSDLKEGKVTLDELSGRDLPTLTNTYAITAILDADRRSLDLNTSIIIDNVV
jgi:hypothetical protein